MKSSLKLTREMKLALTGAALVGAVGGWYAWDASRLPAEPPLASAPSSAAPDTAAPKTADGDSAGTPDTASAAVTVTRPNNPVQIEQIPFLTTAQTTEQSSAPTSSSLPRDEVNADANLPNPFRPFSLAAQTPNAPGVSTALPVPTAPQAPQVQRAQTPPPVVRAPQSPGLPLISAPIPLPSANVVSAAPFPNTAPAASTPPLPGAVPLPVTATPPKALTVKPNLPRQKPPVPTLRAPATASIRTPAAVAHPGAGSTTASGPGSATAAAPSVAVVPPVLTELPDLTASTAPASTGPDSGPVNPLDAFLADQGLSYNAVVLGPVNTGIFQTKSGYVVVSIGQKLPNSDIVVKDITASAVTLALGDSQKTLELDKR